MAQHRRGKEEPRRLGEDAADPARMPLGVYVFALAWLVVPAIQYVGTDQRMRLITGQNAPLAGLALTDFTVAYLLMMIATLIYAAVGALRSRDKVQ